MVVGVVFWCNSSWGSVDGGGGIVVTFLCGSEGSGVAVIWVNRVVGCISMAKS